MNNEATLKRTLTLWHVVLFGLAYMTPMIVFGTYGVLAEVTQGAVPLAYLVAMSAMLFTANSYGQMVKSYPISGSAYTYARKTMGAPVGFMVGWAVLLDYFFLPMVIWLIGGVYLNAAFPDIPIWIWILLFIVITTSINTIGINVTTKVNLIMMIFQLSVIIIFITLSSISLINGMGSGQLFTMEPFALNNIPPSSILAGAAIACYSFLGFDAVSTLSEEVIEPEKTMPKAILLITLFGGLIFMVTSYFLHNVAPSFSQFGDAESASFEIAKQIGGNLFSALFLAGLIVAQFASGLSAQTSAARLLYAMGRDKVLPKAVFGFINSRFRTPVINLILVGIFGMLALFMDMATSTSFINFGAFIAFTFVNMSVIFQHFVFEKKRSFKSWFIYLIFPILGMCFTIGLFLNLDSNAMTLGSIWIVIGFVYLLYLTKFFTKKTPEINFDEET